MRNAAIGYQLYNIVIFHRCPPLRLADGDLAQHYQAIKIMALIMLNRKILFLIYLAHERLIQSGDYSINQNL